MTSKPEPGDVVFHEPGLDTWHQHGGVVEDITRETLVDVTEPDHFTVRGTLHPQWEVIVKDDDESSGIMRRGVVQAWAY